MEGFRIIGLVLAFAFVQFINASSIKDPEPKLPVFLGTIEGKSYFKDDNTVGNWTNANQVCNASGMHLATITTAAQLSFLNTADANGDLPMLLYWIGAREARELRMFSWDLTGNDMSTVFSGFGDGLGKAFSSCLTYYPSHSTRLWAYQCSTTRSDLGILCET